MVGKAKTRAHEEVCVVDVEEDITTDDTMVQYVHFHEFDPMARQQLIFCFCSMWTVNRSKDFSKNGIVNMLGGLIIDQSCLRLEWWRRISNHSVIFIGYFICISLNG